MKEYSYLAASYLVTFLAFLILFISYIEKGSVYGSWTLRYKENVSEEVSFTSTSRGKND